MDPKAIPLMYLAEQFQKTLMLTPTIEKGPPLDSPMHDMIPPIRNIDSKGSGHTSSQHNATGKLYIDCLDVTLCWSGRNKR